MIYVACLAAYNAGHQHGLLLDAARGLVPPRNFLHETGSCLYAHGTHSLRGLAGRYPSISAELATSVSYRGRENGLWRAALLIEGIWDLCGGCLAASSRSLLAVPAER
jgi:hypothetical protein